eukprot:426662-Alexandrium_andersonii.AAC.1
MTWMGAFGAPTPKPSELRGSAPWMRQLHKKLKRANFKGVKEAFVADRISDTLIWPPVFSIAPGGPESKTIVPKP